MKRKSLCLHAAFLLLAALMVALPGPANGEMYVEAYLGGCQPANMGQTFNVRDVSPGLNGVHQINRLDFSGKAGPTVLGGLKLGTWFVKEGFLGYSYPDWMKYFGFYLDF
ncbi:MAG: hypothetical protein HY913_03810, partial [Desulfomonile tiedjei]|nr:hypothetical protein [Desulfomonile tiedjei]